MQNPPPKHPRECCVPPQNAVFELQLWRSEEEKEKKASMGQKEGRTGKKGNRDPSPTSLPFGYRRRLTSNVTALSAACHRALIFYSLNRCVEWEWEWARETVEIRRQTNWFSLEKFSLCLQKYPKFSVHILKIKGKIQYINRIMTDTDGVEDGALDVKAELGDRLIFLLKFTFTKKANKGKKKNPCKLVELERD